jgi:hypothetical protein
MSGVAVSLPPYALMARHQVKENARMYINLFHGNTEQENENFVMCSFYEVYSGIV